MKRLVTALFMTSSLAGSALACGDVPDTSASSKSKPKLLAKVLPKANTSVKPKVQATPMPNAKASDTPDVDPSAAPEVKAN